MSDDQERARWEGEISQKIRDLTSSIKEDRVAWGKRFDELADDISEIKECVTGQKIKLVHQCGERLQGCSERMHTFETRVETDAAVQKTRQGLWGTLGGAVSVVIFYIAKYFWIKS